MLFLINSLHIVKSTVSMRLFVVYYFSPFLTHLHRISIMANEVRSTWVWSRKFKPPTAPSKKTIMQVDTRLLGIYGDVVAFHNGMWPLLRILKDTENANTYGEAPDPRVCPKGCRFEKKNGDPDGTHQWLSDRVYHCTNLGRCLPVYDHYCKYIRAAVYRTP
jgi:hypothetical protein